MAKRVLLGKEGSNYVLKVSKPSVDVIDDTINDRDYLFNSEMYRAGVIRSNSTYTSMTTSGVDLPTTSDSSGNAYIPAFIISEKGAFYPQARFDEQYGSGGASGGNIRGRIVNALNTAAGGGMFQFSLNSSGTTKNKVIPYFVDIDGMTDPRPGEGDGTYPFFAARSRASSDGDVKVQILGIPCQFGKMTNNATLFGNSVLTGTNSGEGGSSGGGGTASAPTITGTSRTARNNTNDTVAVAASNGTNNSGTITYAQGSSNSASSLSFQSSNSFSHPRGTTRYYFAKQSNLVSTTTGTNHVHASAAVDNTPSGFNNLTATAASGAAGTAQYTIAGLGTGDTASVSTSAGSVSASSGVNGTTITFSLNASGSGGNTTSANITVGTTTRTFVVTTATDNTPTFNPSDFTNATEQEPSATVTSNAITVGGINVGLSVSVSGCTVSIAGGSFVSSGTVTNGQTVTIRSTASSSFATATNPSVTIGSTTINQTVTTRASVTASAPTSMTATQSTNSNNNTETVTCAASGGSGTLQFSNDNSNWGTGTTFTQTRNTTVTYYARRTAEAGASSAISVTEFVPPLFVIGTYSNTSSVSASGGTISNASSGTQSYMNIFSGSTYGTVSLSASATTNPSSMLSSVAISSIGTVTGTVASNSGSARTGTITVSATTSQGGSPSSKTFNVPQVAAASNLWEVGITMGGGNTGSGYSGFFAFHGSTTDTSCDLFTGTPAWRFYDVPQSSTNTFFWVSGVFSNTGWTTLKIYNGTSASGTLLATVARTSCTHANPFFTGSTSWELPADYTSTSGNRYLVFT
jgi:hypothetical protein|tara:strand:- start:984 stop:3401 length:2418 start_codon:yes stop_codon:yes gene_type:complete